MKEYAMTMIIVMQKCLMNTTKYQNTTMEKSQLKFQLLFMLT